MSKINAGVVDLFCGAGGLSQGFFSEGFKISAGIDSDKRCAHAFAKNNDSKFVACDVAELTKDQIDGYFGDSEFRILVGCAPCQPFSSYSKKANDPNWNLVTKFADLIEQVLPDVVSMENVPRLISFDDGRVFESFVKRLRAARYYVVWKVLYGPDYGMAQTRSRLVLLASRLAPIELPTPTHRKGTYRTVKDEIGDLAAVENGKIDGIDTLHRARKLNDINVRRITASVPGGTWSDWNDDLILTCHRQDSGQSYGAVYGRMEWLKPSPTITTQFYNIGTGRFGHPEQARGLTLREGAMLQGFPRGYEFVEPGKEVHFASVGRMIGNAVPVKLASAIATAVKSHLADAKAKGRDATPFLEEPGDRSQQSFDWMSPAG